MKRLILLIVCMWATTAIAQSTKPKNTTDRTLEIKNKEILQVATGIFGKNWEVSSFLDTDTGLRAKNHFVLNYVEPVVVEEPEDEKAKAKSFFERLGIKQEMI